MKFTWGNLFAKKVSPNPFQKSLNDNRNKESANFQVLHFLFFDSIVRSSCVKHFSEKLTKYLDKTVKECYDKYKCDDGKEVAFSYPFPREMTVGASHEEGGVNTFPEQHTERICPSRL